MPLPPAPSTGGVPDSPRFICGQALESQPLFLEATLFVGYSGQHRAALRQLTLGPKPAPAPGGRAGWSMGRNREAGGGECSILPNTQAAGGKRNNNNNHACRKLLKNKALNK